MTAVYGFTSGVGTVLSASGYHFALRVGTFDFFGTLIGNGALLTASACMVSDPAAQAIAGAGAIVFLAASGGPINDSMVMEVWSNGPTNYPDVLLARSSFPLAGEGNALQGSGGLFGGFVGLMPLVPGDVNDGDMHLMVALFTEPLPPLLDTVLWVVIYPESLTPLPDPPGLDGFQLATDNPWPPGLGGPDIAGLIPLYSPPGFHYPAASIGLVYSVSAPGSRGRVSAQVIG